MKIKILPVAVLLIVFFFQSNQSYSQRDTSEIFADSVSIDDIHPQDLPPNSGFILRAKDGKSYLRIIGSVRLNGAYDLNGLQSQETFSTYDIPVGAENMNEPRFIFGAYQTRFGIEIYKPTPLGNVFAKIEADFEGSKNNLRLREGYAVIKNFLLGKSWSVFGDPESIPKTVDKDGPNSSVTERAVQIRFEPPEQNMVRYAFALEVPNPDITNAPDSIEITPFYQSFPDLTARFEIKSDSWGQIQFSSIVRSITVRDIDENLQVLAGYGGLFSGKLNFFDGNTFYYQFVGGKGISNYIEALSGTGLDVIFDTQNNEYVTMTAYGGFVSFSRQWSDLLSTGLTLGLTYMVNRDFQPDDAFKYSTYGSFNAFANISKVMKLGLEYSYGARINKNYDYGTANRISFKSIVDF